MTYDRECLYTWSALISRTYPIWEKNACKNNELKNEQNATSATNLFLALN